MMSLIYLIVQVVINSDAFKEKPIWNKDYAENTIMKYTPDEFGSHFRMLRQAVEHMTSLIAPFLMERHNLPGFLEARDRFGTSGGTGHFIFTNVCKQ